MEKTLATENRDSRKDLRWKKQIHTNKKFPVEDLSCKLSHASMLFSASRNMS